VRLIGAAESGPDAPYPGSLPFLRADQDRFFGRGTETRALAEFWQDNRLVLVVGPVASGKTSILHAGVLPVMALKRAHILPPGRISYGATFPSGALPEHNPYTLALLCSWSPGEMPTRLVDLTVRDFVGEAVRGHDGPVYAAIDQVDDLLTESGSRQDYRDKFLGQLAAAVRAEPRLHLLLLTREDGADLIAARLSAAARFEFAALTRQGAIEAVAGPVVGTKRSFADGAAEELVTDLQTSRIMVLNGAERHVHSDRVEPALLQAVCRWLWDSLPSETGHITTRDVRLFGNADKALAAYCGRTIASVADDYAKPVAWVRNWLLRTFVTELGTRGMAYEGVVETAGMPNEVARALADRHLLSVQLRSGSRWYELLTDRLIQPLRYAIDELPPTTEPAEYVAAAERALARGELAGAQRYAEATLRGSADTDLWLRANIESLLGNIAAERGEYAAAKAEAESHYRASAHFYETLHDAPAVASQLAAVGQMLMARERPEDALDEFRAAIDRMPGDPVFQAGLALALWRLGESRAAVTVLTAVLGADGGNTIALRARGEILAELGEARQAMLDLDRVSLEERPSTRAARGLALAKLGDRSGANLEVDDAVAEAPWNGVVLLHAARAKALTGDENAAEELAWRAADAGDPGLPPYHREAALKLADHKHGNSADKLAPGISHGRVPKIGDAFH
jgi:tetratricopeptide (TPR) repeat protein